MVVLKKPENATNVVEYEVNGNKIDFEDGSLIINLARREADETRTIDICRDIFGDIVIGAGTGETYLAQIIIPPRLYTEVETEEGTVQEPVPFNIDRVTLILWEER